MTVPPVEGTPPVPGKPIEFSTGSGESTADKDMFLKLLVAQMRYQDPMNPTDSSQFLSQSAQFTSLEKMSTVADQTSRLVGLQVAFGASALVGRSVSYPAEDGTPVSGVVTSVRFDETGPVLQVDGEDVAYTELLAVGDGSTDLTTLTTAAQTATGRTTREAGTT